MSGAYRDDLGAARARVGDLEREAAQLRARNAQLESVARQKREARQIAQQPEAEATQPSAAVRAMVVLTRICVGIGVIALGGSRHEHPPISHPVPALIAFALAFVFWCCSGFRRVWT